MKQFFGMSQRGNLDEALQGLHAPQFIMLLSNENQLEAHAAALEKRFPGVPKGDAPLAQGGEDGGQDAGVVAGAEVDAHRVPARAAQTLQIPLQALDVLHGHGGGGRSAKQVYKDILHVTDEEIPTRTFQNPFGKLNGDDTCIISIKEVTGSALTQVMDWLTKRSL